MKRIERPETRIQKARISKKYWGIPKYTLKTGDLYSKTGYPWESKKRFMERIEYGPVF